MNQLQDKNVIITGAMGAIGRAAALRCAREGASVSIVSADNAGAAAAREIGAKARFVQAKPAEFGAAVKDAAQGLDGLHALVNIVQPATPWKSFIDKGPGGFDVSFDGLRATVAAMQSAYPHLKKRGGRVVNVGSVYGATSFSQVTDSITSDFALQGLTRAVGVEWAEDQILVNYLEPAAMDVPEFRRWREQHPAEIDRLVAGLAMRRLGDPIEDFGGGLMFLLSDEACFLVGHAVRVDGGQHMVAPVLEPGARFAAA
jgi:NAD(P)-dependent dehydrogenase (short-subunit alcohol dehydrogenase family)